MRREASAPARQYWHYTKPFCQRRDLYVYHQDLGIDLTGKAGSNIEVQVWAGSMNRGACSTDGKSITCYDQFLLEDMDYAVPAHNLAVPFTAPLGPIPTSDYDGFWIFAKPSASANCKLDSYYTEEHN
jgi:hypothetical protein